LPLSGIQLIDQGNIPAPRRHLYVWASLMAIFGNLLLLVAKIIAAHISGSSAIRADAANSASDVAYSLFMGLGLWLSLRPADSSHPHGHRRIESLVGVVIGVMMGLAGVEALRHGIDTWHKGTIPILSAWSLTIMLGSGLVKGLMYLIAKKIGQAASSPALLASARDNLNDIVSSGMALLGVLGSNLVFAADPVAALLVSIWILRSTWQVLWESLGQLIGGAVAPEVTQAVLEAARGVTGVLDVHQLIVERAGPQAYVDIHIDMDGSTNLYRAHQVSEAVRDAIEALDAVDHAFVHVEPIET